MSPRIVVVGFNPAIDRVLEISGFRAGGVHKAVCRLEQPAGKAANVARVLGLLGHACTLAGFVGQDEESRYVHSFSGLPVAVRLVCVKGSTRTNTTIVDPGSGADTHIREAGFAVSAGEWAVLCGNLLENCGPDVWFVFSGSLAPGIDPAAAVALVRDIAGRGGRIAVDASGPFLRELRHFPVDLLKVNREEYGELVGRDIAPEQPMMPMIYDDFAAGRLAARRLFVTDGAHGGGICEAGSGWWALSPQVKVLSTVGAGDASLAGVLGAVQDGVLLPEHVCHGLAAGAAAVEELAAGVVDPSRVAGLLGQVVPQVWQNGRECGKSADFL